MTRLEHGIYINNCNNIVHLIFMQFPKFSNFYSFFFQACLLIFVLISFYFHMESSSTFAINHSFSWQCVLFSSLFDIHTLSERFQDHSCESSMSSPVRYFLTTLIFFFVCYHCHLIYYLKHLVFFWYSFGLAVFLPSILIFVFECLFSSAFYSSFIFNKIFAF